MFFNTYLSPEEYEQDLKIGCTGEFIDEFKFTKSGVEIVTVTAIVTAFQYPVIWTNCGGYHYSRYKKPDTANPEQMTLF